MTNPGQLPIPEVQPQPAPAPAPVRAEELPAYPCANALKAKYRGISVRDYFAAMAMQGMMSVAVPGPDGRPTVGNVPTATGRSITETAYAVADAMMKVREK